MDKTYIKIRLIEEGEKVENDELAVCINKNSIYFHVEDEQASVWVLQEKREKAVQLVQKQLTEQKVLKQIQANTPKGLHTVAITIEQYKAITAGFVDILLARQGVQPQPPRMQFKTETPLLTPKETAEVSAGLEEGASDDN